MIGWRSQFPRGGIEEDEAGKGVEAGRDFFGSGAIEVNGAWMLAEDRLHGCGAPGRMVKPEGRI